MDPISDHPPGPAVISMFEPIVETEAPLKKNRALFTLFDPDIKRSPWILWFPIKLFEPVIANDPVLGIAPAGPCCPWGPTVATLITLVVGCETDTVVLFPLSTMLTLLVVVEVTVTVLLSVVMFIDIYYGIVVTSLLSVITPSSNLVTVLPEVISRSYFAFAKVNAEDDTAEI